VKLSLVLRVSRSEDRLGKQGRRNRVGEQSRGTWERKNGRGVEGRPRANVTNIPPKVLGAGISHRERDMADQGSSGVGGGEEVQKISVGSRIRRGSEAQGGLRSRSVAVGGEAVVRLLLRSNGTERRHLAVCGIAIAVNCGGIKAGSAS
jgi:hypothetical protein